MTEARRTPLLLEPLVQVGDGIYFYDPPEPRVNEVSITSSDEPALIILCTWLGGATPRNLSKYVSGYRQLFPSSAILLVTSQLSEITITPFSIMQTRLKPARNIILRFLGATDGDGPCMLWHILSNGGLNTAIQLALMVKSRQRRRTIATKEPEETEINNGGNYDTDCVPQLQQHALDFALRGVIFDCCPGDDTFEKTYGAAAVSLPKTQPGKMLATAVLYPTVFLLLKLQNSGYMSSLGDLARGANSPAIFGMGVRRLYLYSESDMLIDFRFVEEHLALAKEKGFDARGQMVPGGSHCALVRGDAARYWKSIERFWKGAEKVDKKPLALESRL